MHDEDKTVRMAKGCGNVTVDGAAREVGMPHVTIQHDMRNVKNGVNADKCPNVIAAHVELDIIDAVDNLRGKARNPRLEACRHLSGEFFVFVCVILRCSLWRPIDTGQNFAPCCRDLNEVCHDVEACLIALTKGLVNYPIVQIRCVGPLRLQILAAW